MSKFKTYEDLLQEEQRLQVKLKASEVLIRQDLAGVKESLKPMGRVMNVLSKLTTRDHTGPLANFGVEFGIDLLFRRFILARAGWFTKILVPYIIKNYSSHLITEQQKAKIMQKINDIFRKIRPKPEPQAEEKGSPAGSAS
ncbi:MAG TPA: hypothetical protein VFZ78_08255 [Flavisolibacter sp.]